MANTKSKHATLLLATETPKKNMSFVCYDNHSNINNTEASSNNSNDNTNSNSASATSMVVPGRKDSKSSGSSRQRGKESARDRQRERERESLAYLAYLERWTERRERQSETGGAGALCRGEIRNSLTRCAKGKSMN